MATGMTDKKAKAQTVATSSKNRRARKKRRTEISSSEEDSSDDGDSSSDGDANDSDNAVEDAPAELQTQQDAVAEIEHLRVRSRAPVPGDEKTAEDVVQTRMKLRQMQDLLVADGAAAVGDGGASESQDVAAVSSDDWLKLMLSQYGDDIDALRTGDSFLRSVYMVADLDNMEIGLATANHDNNDSEDIEVLSTGIPSAMTPASSLTWGAQSTSMFVQSGVQLSSIPASQSSYHFQSKMSTTTATTKRDSNMKTGTAVTSTSSSTVSSISSGSSNAANGNASMLNSMYSFTGSLFLLIAAII
ncbi:hypothetical protein PMKS-002034 [Pichia membranifaciens]|uniref:Uncharacterized protein n=1 Tax=Pichia membranifaciens TaxID=4926 RepID=A0A1Q2YGP9_9ASCO|nr:hypothetical protein PMKS-002034 [Pichia membranifaciens]